MSTSRLSIQPVVASSPADGVTSDTDLSSLSDTALNSVICFSFRLMFRSVALDIFRDGVKRLQIIESWILVELAKNGRLEQPFALDQLFTVSNAKTAVDRYLEMEFWRQEWDISVAWDAFRRALLWARNIADEKTVDNPHSVAFRYLAAEVKHMDLLQYVPPADEVPHASLFDKIESGKMTGVWKMEKGWKIKIQTAFDLFHTQLTTSLSTLAQADSLTPSFTYFLQCHPNPYHLINRPSPTEAPDSSLAFTELSQDEYDDQITVWRRFCFEGGHQRGGKRFIEKKRAYDEYQMHLKNGLQMHLKNALEQKRQS
jgi:hypothetical protein